MPRATLMPITSVQKEIDRLGELDRRIDPLLAKTAEIMTREINLWLDDKATEPSQETLSDLTLMFYNGFVFSWAYGGSVVASDATGSAAFAFADLPLIPIDAIRYIINKMSLPQEILNETQARIATYSSKLAQLTGADGFARVKLLMARTLLKGESKVEWIERVSRDEILKKTGFNPRDPWYADNVWRTNVATAYNAGKYDSMINGGLPVAYVEYHAIEDARTTEICSSLAGTIASWNSPLWDEYWPPNHYMCRSTVSVISRLEAKVLDVQEKDPKGDLTFPKGNESFRSNPSRDFGRLSPDQQRKARDLGLDI